jgi:hypothetical protein
MGRGIPIQHNKLHRIAKATVWTDVLMPKKKGDENDGIEQMEEGQKSDNKKLIVSVHVDRKATSSHLRILRS